MNAERGPLHRYEVTWANGHVEYIEAHQCLIPQASFLSIRDDVQPRWTFHGEIDGVWRLILTAPEDQIRSVRDVTITERAPGGGS
jgi:hypothetical protein